MLYLTLIFIAFTLVGCVFTILALVPKDAFRKILVGLFAVLVGFGYLGFSSLLSLPKPVHLEFFTSENEVPILYSKVVAKDKIYLLVSLSGSVPRYFSMPWTKEREEQLKEAGRKAKRYGIPLFMLFNFEENLDTNKKLFYPMPQARPENEKD